MIAAVSKGVTIIHVTIQYKFGLEPNINSMSMRNLKYNGT